MQMYLEGVRRSADIHQELSRIRCPVLLVRAYSPFDPKHAQLPSPLEEGASLFAASPTDPELASYFTGATRVEERSEPHMQHFIPLEAPSLVASQITRFLASQSRL